MTKPQNPELGQTEHPITNCKRFKKICCFVILQLIIFFYYYQFYNDEEKITVQE